MSSLPLMITDTQQAISSGLRMSFQTQSLHGSSPGAAPGERGELTEFNLNRTGTQGGGGRVLTPRRQHASMAVSTTDRQPQSGSRTGRRRWPSELRAERRPERSVQRTRQTPRVSFPHHWGFMVLGAVLYIGKNNNNLKHTTHRDRTDEDRDMVVVCALPHVVKGVMSSFLPKNAGLLQDAWLSVRFAKSVSRPGFAEAGTFLCRKCGGRQAENKG